MNREQLAHVLRAAATITSDGDIIVIGSQAILATIDDQALPLEAIRSMEVDVAFRDDDAALKADKVDGALGEGSAFHQEFGYYGQGVEVRTATLPQGWRSRTVPFDRMDSHPGRAQCLEPHDLVISKLYAGREKDKEFTVALIRAELISVDMLRSRAELLDVPGAVIRRVKSLINSCQRVAETI